MNREEAAAVLDAMIFGVYPDDDITINKIGIEAVRFAINALRGPQPDPITGLVPCGCGGKAILFHQPDIEGPGSDDPTRMHEVLMEEKEMTPEERLLREIFAKSEQDEMPDNYPETYFEKADYAMFCIHKSLESISPALGRISRLCGLLRLGEKDGKNTTPRIITHDGSRMALRHLTMVKRDVDDAYQEILSIFENTKEPGAVSEEERVDQKGGN